MSEQMDIFEGDDPFTLARRWMAEAKASEPNDPDAAALSTVDPSGLPNVRIVLMREIEDDAFVFYTNYTSAKGAEIEAAGKAAFVIHWKSLRRQIRVRGTIARVASAQSDRYFAARPVDSRIGAYASRQSQPLESREALLADVERLRESLGPAPERPAHWGGYRIAPVEIEFWADGAFRLHDRFRWTRQTQASQWLPERLFP